MSKMSNEIARLVEDTRTAKVRLQRAINYCEAVYPKQPTERYGSLIKEADILLADIESEEARVMLKNCITVLRDAYFPKV